MTGAQLVELAYEHPRNMMQCACMTDATALYATKRRAELLRISDEWVKHMLDTALSTMFNISSTRSSTCTPQPRHSHLEGGGGVQGAVVQ